MGVYHGKSAMAGFGGDLNNMVNFTLTTTVEMASSTAMGDTWENHEYGLTDFTITAESHNVDALDTPAILGTSAEVTLDLEDGGTDKIAGTALLTSIVETQPVDDIGKITFGFEGNDADGLTYTIS